MNYEFGKWYIILCAHPSAGKVFLCLPRPVVCISFLSFQTSRSRNRVLHPNAHLEGETAAAHAGHGYEWGKHATLHDAFIGSDDVHQHFAHCIWIRSVCHFHINVNTTSGCLRGVLQASCR